MSDVQGVKDAVSIVDVIGRYVELQQSGGSFKGKCPFHQERTPSFYVWPDRQYWKCFGACDEGGDVISFLIKIENMDFPEALRSLAFEGGVELASRRSKKRQNEHEPLYQLMGQAAAYFRQNLLLGNDRDAGKARAYLAERMIAPETAEAFEIGISLWNRTSLLDFMISQEYGVEDLLTVNLVIEQDDGALRDRFMGLLMLPIRNAQGKVIGFGARQLPPESDSFGKYMNTASTPIFNKSEVLYGIDKAKDSIRRERQAIIVEGYFDAISAHQYGHANTVACMGTAVTPDHILQLQGLATKITFALDADAAGQRATIRNLDRSRMALHVVNQDGRRQSGAKDEVQLTIVRIPRGKDPDELMRTDPNAWPRLVKKDKTLVDFYAEYLPSEYDFGIPEEKQKAVSRMAEVLAGFEQPVTREGYIEKAANSLEVGKAVLNRLVEEAFGGRRADLRAKTSHPKTADAASLSPAPRKEDRLLAALYWNPKSVLQSLNESLTVHHLEPLGLGDFRHAESIAVFEVISEYASADVDWRPETLYQRLNADLHQHVGLLEGISGEFRNNDGMEVSRAALEHLVEVRKRSVNHDLELLNLGEDTSSLEGAERTQEKRQSLYLIRRTLDEAKDRIQTQIVSE